MDVDETAIGQWPNIAIDPRTGRHAATGEDVGKPDAGVALNRLAREQMKRRLLADVLVDMQVCQLEGIDHTEYVGELCEEMTRIAVGFREGSALIDWHHVCGRCHQNISIFKDTCPSCGAVFDMTKPFVRRVVEVES